MPNLGLNLSRTANSAISGETPFSPLDLPNLFEWFSADHGALKTVDPDVLALDFQAVTRWVNKAPSGVNANQLSAATQPIYRELGGFSFLDFKGDVLQLDYPAAINPPLSYYFVGFFGAGNAYLVNRATNTLSARNTLFNSGGTIRLQASTAVNSGVSISNEAVVCGVLEGGGTGLVGKAENLGLYSETTLSGLGTTASTQLTNFLGGATNVGGNSNCGIYEFLAYNQAHNATDRLKVVNYLRGKYGK